MIKQVFMWVALFNVGISIGMAHHKMRSASDIADAYIQELVTHQKFSGSVLIAHNGEVLLSKGYGMSNYEFDIPNTPDTKFRIGSITKQFTAFAFMQLVKQGLVSVNDPVSNFIPDYPHGDGITMHHLLTHSSGIVDFLTLPEQQVRGIVGGKLDDIITWFKDQPLEFEPGSRYKYSNSGYILLTRIIEIVSGKSYEEYVQDTVFTPYGIAATGYAHSHKIVKERAAGYSCDTELVNAPYIAMNVPQGAGGLYSTTKDLLRWDRVLYAQRGIDALVENPMEMGDSKEYGYGVIINRSGDGMSIGHHGIIPGFQSNMVHFMDDDITIIVLSNFDFVSMPEITEGIIKALFSAE